MKLIQAFALFLVVSSTTAEITRSECEDQGGQVVGDIGNGAIFQPDYVCESTGEAPTDIVVPDDPTTGPFASEGEVCCGGTGSGIETVTTTNGGLPGSGLPGTEPQTCLDSADCPLIQCLVAPCPDHICVDGVCQVQTETQEEGSANPGCYQDSDCPPINCFAAPCDVNICNDNGVCVLVPPPEDGENSGCLQDSDCPPINCFAAPCDINICTDAGVCELVPPPEVGEPLPNPVDEEMPTMSRSKCETDLGGVIVGDIGDGAVFEPGYICESNEQPPLGLVVAEEGEPIATDGEVCCGPPSPSSATNQTETATREECTDELNGVIVGDIGDGAIFDPNYICDSNGQPPIAEIVPGEGEPIAIEGEVCCGQPVERETVTRQECTEELEGIIVGDIGDGAIFAPDYVCESSGEPPLADIVPAEGEPIAIEGEVCCGRGPMVFESDSYQERGDSDIDEEFLSGADKLTVGSVVATFFTVGAIVFDNVWA